MRRILRAAQLDRALQGRALRYTAAILTGIGAITTALPREGASLERTGLVMVVFALVVSVGTAICSSWLIDAGEDPYISAALPVVGALNTLIVARSGETILAGSTTAGVGIVGLAVALGLRYLQRRGTVPRDPAVTRTARSIQREAAAGTLSVKEAAVIHRANCPHRRGEDPDWKRTKTLVADIRGLENLHHSIMEAAEQSLGRPLHTVARNLHQADLDFEGRSFDCPVDLLLRGDVTLRQLGTFADRAPFGTVETLWKVIRSQQERTLAEATEAMNLRLAHESWRRTLEQLHKGWKGDGEDLVGTVELISAVTTEGSAA